MTQQPEIRRRPPPAYIRVCVVVGIATILIGVAGIFIVERPVPAFLRLQGAIEELAADPNLAYEVEASWENDQGELAGEAGTSGRDPDVWLFYNLPKEREVTVIVHRLTNGERTEVVRRTQAFERGKLTELGIPR